MKNFTAYTDSQLLQLLKNGDKNAFECIYKRHWSILFDAAYKRVKSKEVAEEIIQDLFTYLWCKREELQLTHSFSTYIHAALKYRVFNYVRKEITKNRYIDVVKHLPPQLNNTVEEGLFFNELSSAYEKEINNLPERCRQVFNLSRKNNLPLKEIATKLNISINTVEKQLGKAIKIIRGNLKDYVAIITSLLPFF